MRRQGAGRKKAAEKDPTLVADLDRLVDPVTRGDAESPLRWTCKSVRQLAQQLQQQGHPVSYQTVAQLLHARDYSLPANHKTLAGSRPEDRDQQFGCMNRQAEQYLRRDEPLISVDTKKKELVGECKNGGRERRPKGRPERVRLHDFAIPELGKVAPDGVYDVGRKVGWVSVGVDHDTAALAVESIRRWWRWMGQPKLSPSPAAVDYGRFGRQQWRPGAVVEMGVAEVGRRDRTRHPGLPFPARDQQVE